MSFLLPYYVLCLNWDNSYALQSDLIVAQFPINLSNPIKFNDNLGISKANQIKINYISILF